MFSRYIQLGTCTHCHYGYHQTIPWTPTAIEGNIIVDKDERWIHLLDHLVMGLIKATHAFACVESYMEWYKYVSQINISCDGGRSID